MKVGIFGDVHATKNMRTLQDVWEKSLEESIHQVYDTFDEQKVDWAICLGDFFDKPVIEAKHLHFLIPILNHINSRDYPTYILLGNHEIDDLSHNILEYLKGFDKIRVVDTLTSVLNCTMIPYTEKIEELDPVYLKNDYIFTHHDIYGSALAGGQTSAFFGIPTEYFKDAKRVFNGHVHLKSMVTPTIMNVGSLLVSQHGELRYKDLPQYLILDTETGEVETYTNTHSPVFVSINESEIKEALEVYRDQERIFRIDYTGEIPTEDIDAHVSWRKLVTDIGNSQGSTISREHNFDFKSYLVNHIKNDMTIIESEKDDYIKVGLEVLG